MENLQSVKSRKHVKDPPKLTAEAIRSLLEQFLRLAKKVTRSAPRFLKMLTVSKTFMNLARDYPTYSLRVYIVNQSDYIYVLFGKEFDPSNYSELFGCEQHSLPLIPISYDNVYELTNLLKPKNFFIMLCDVSPSSELPGQCKDLFSLIDQEGKCGLSMGAVDYEELILRQAAPYLDFLDCSFDTLKKADVMHSLDLDYYTGVAIRKADLEVLMRYKIQHLFFYGGSKFDDEFGIGELDLKPSQIESSLQSLEINHFNSSHKSLLLIVRFLKRSFPKLRSLSIDFTFHDVKLCPQNRSMELEAILKNLQLIHEKLKGMKEYCQLMPPSKLSIRARSIFRVSQNSNFNCKWIEKIKCHEGFKTSVDHHHHTPGCCDVIFKPEYGSFTIMHKVRIYQYGANF